jgi:UDP:flavonoid glycosyltransferase YjiC (YdhE family)
VACRPLFADQARNGRAIQDAGAGVLVAGDAAPPGGLRSLGPEDVPVLRRSIEEALDEPRYRDAARRIEAEMASAPSLEELCRTLSP